MSGVNKVILVGYLGADPEVRHTQAGAPVASMRIATNETWRDKTTGERKERTEWHSVVIWNEPLVKVAEQYLKKGSRVYIEGKLSTRKWQAKDGSDRYTTEVVLQGFNAQLTMLDGASGNRPPPAESPDEYGKTQSSGEQRRPPLGGARPSDMDDEIPF